MGTPAGSPGFITPRTEQGAAVGKNVSNIRRAQLLTSNASDELPLMRGCVNARRVSLCRTLCAHLVFSINLGIFWRLHMLNFRVSASLLIPFRGLMFCIRGIQGCPSLPSLFQLSNEQHLQSSSQSASIHDFSFHNGSSTSVSAYADKILDFNSEKNLASMRHIFPTISLEVANARVRSCASKTRSKHKTLAIFSLLCLFVCREYYFCSCARSILPVFTSVGLASKA